jgi:hypothetical protein
LILCSIGLRSLKPDSISADLSSICVYVFGMKSRIKKQAKTHRDQVQRQNQGQVADSPRKSPAMQHRTAVGTRRLPSDLCRPTAIKTMVDRVTYLGATRIHESFLAGLPVEQDESSATKHRDINPCLERWYVARVGSHKIEDAGTSHSICVLG